MILRLITLNVFAVSAAPVIASSELAALLGQFLVTLEICTADQIKDMTCEEMKDKLRPIVSSGALPTDSPDAVNNLRSSFYNLITSPAATVSGKLVTSAVGDWITDFIDDYSCLKPTSTTDLQGYSSLLVCKHYAGIDDPLTGDYVSADAYFYSNSAGTFRNRNGDKANYFIAFNRMDYVYNGRVLESQYINSSFISSFYISNHSDREFYGTWLWDDGTPSETNDVTIPAIGEADGTTVTPDMLNPDGTVTINNTTYYPKDYIDMDKFDDTAIIDLLGEILDKIDNTTVVVQNNDTVQDMVGDVSVELDIGELNNFKMPVSIADVFPFCLPFDFVRGFKGLVSKPEIPVFKSELDLTDFCGYNLGKHTIEVSLEKWEPAVVIFRWFSLILFSYALILLTGKIVKGAGA